MARKSWCEEPEPLGQAAGPDPGKCNIFSLWEKPCFGIYLGILNATLAFRLFCCFHLHVKLSDSELLFINSRLALAEVSFGAAASFRALGGFVGIFGA